MSYKDSGVVQKVADDTLKLSGVIDFDTTPLLEKSLNTALSDISAKTVVLDLTDLDGFNTAGLACLVNCAITIRNHGQCLQLQNVPANVHKLAKLSGVDSILGLQ